MAHEQSLKRRGQLTTIKSSKDRPCKFYNAHYLSRDVKTHKIIFASTPCNKKITIMNSYVQLVHTFVRTLYIHHSYMTIILSLISIITYLTSYYAFKDLIFFSMSYVCTYSSSILELEEKKTTLIAIKKNNFIYVVIDKKNADMPRKTKNF